MYTIFFENKASASAPAQEFFLTDTLDDNLHWSTFQLTEIMWGEHVVAIPPKADTRSVRETIADYRPDAGSAWWGDVEVQLIINAAPGIESDVWHDARS